MGQIRRNITRITGFRGRINKATREVARTRKFVPTVEDPEFTQPGGMDVTNFFNALREKDAAGIERKTGFRGLIRRVAAPRGAKQRIGSINYHRTIRGLRANTAKGDARFEGKLDHVHPLLKGISIGDSITVMSKRGNIYTLVVTGVRNGLLKGRDGGHRVNLKLDRLSTIEKY